jgi:hypothetical protein
MREMRRRIAASIRDSRRLPIAVLLLTVAFIGGTAAPARASLGYELNPSTPSHFVSGGPHGIAVDQANHRIYVAILSKEPLTGAAGEIERFESNLNAAGTFSDGSGYYAGVAVNPVTQGFYAAQAAIHVPQGTFGTAKMNLFSSAGVAGTSFSLSDGGTFPQIATDSSGDVFFPNAVTGKVQVFNSAGVVQEEIGCSGCPGSSSFGRPVSVAIDSAGSLYVVDLSPDRVVKLTPSGGSYSFASVLQSGKGAAAVGVDPSDNSVFVGDLPNGSNYHIVAYNSSGMQFDDFGAGLFDDPAPQFGALVAMQIAVDGSTHRLYVGDTGKFYIFNKVTIALPTAAIEPATPVGQLTATLHASANAKGHAAFECRFEYADDSDFLSNGFTNADTAPCSEAPSGSSDTAISARISGLSPVTVYHYRVTVTTNGGSATSGEETFETMPVVSPTVTTEPAAAINQTDAKLTGKVNPHGGSVSNCHFEYGTSVAYGASIPCSALPEPVNTDVVVTRKILKLTQGTTYHFKLVVTTNAGTVEGGDANFTTATPPPPPPDPPVVNEPPVVVPPVVVPPVVAPPPPPLRCKKGFQKRKVRGKVRCVKRKRHAKRRRAHRGA